ncbi:hypothetical protein [Moorena sp. SIO4G3]|uniref:hypothetical protein n=1 Tax=Moorena sp. SIO4G3 TaxID=2607821 RepID=UPI00142D0702|nr:hypothetical protein [Moorena sp. SIO4G3]NEO81364.1 hypothetical protein [Moorena sp. SIO4G3]
MRCKTQIDGNYDFPTPYSLLPTPYPIEKINKKQNGYMMSHISRNYMTDKGLEHSCYL